MRKLLSGIALAALAATTLHSDPGGGKGNGGGKDHGKGSAENSGGNGNGSGNGSGNGGGKPDHGQSAKHEDRGNDNGNGNGDGNDHGNGNKADRGQSMADHRQDDRGWTQPVGKNRAEDRRSENQGRITQNDSRDARRGNWREYDQRGLVNGCPPGLAKKNNGCLPPGQAKQSNYDRYDRNWWGLRGLTNTSGYRYVDGNLVRLSSNGSVMSYYPLLGGALSVGNAWPSGWQSTPLTSNYSNYYGLDNDYRYYDGAIYNVDPGTSTIQRIAALLTGDTFNVGQRMPSGYDAYNVPYQYRNQYADRPDANYRYSDGYVYQTDPKTQLIVAAIQLLT